MTAHILGVLTLIAVALLLGATWYETVVMAPNYERDVPGSILIARQFLVRRTPAHFFRAIAPAAQLMALLTVIFDWHKPGETPFLIGFAALVVADIITFTFHYPLLAIMFTSPQAQDPVARQLPALEWTAGTWLRCVLLRGVFLAFPAGTVDLATLLNR